MSLYEEVEPPGEYAEVLAIDDDAEFLERAFPLLEDPGDAHGRGGSLFSSNSKDLAERRWVKFPRTGLKPVPTRLYLNPARDMLRWDPTGMSRLFSVKKRQSCIEVSHIIRVQRGRTSSNFQRFKFDTGEASADDLEGRTFSVITITRTLDLLASSKVVCNLWVRAINLLSAEEAPGNGNPFRKYLRKMWNTADQDRSGFLSHEEVEGLMMKMNINLHRTELRQMFLDFDKDANGLDLAEFTQLMKSLFSNRPEIVLIMKDIKGVDEDQERGGGLNGAEDTKVSVPVKLAKKNTNKQHPRRVVDAEVEHISARDLALFFNTHQRGPTNKPLSVEEARKAIRDIANDNREADALDVLEMGMWLDHESNEAFDPRRAVLHCSELQSQAAAAYMSQPLSHYWISSSHNTYLVAGQFGGTSSAEQYTYVLQKGCRCVELDVWNGTHGDGSPEGEPMVTHGHALCSKILFRDVVRAIKDSAFGPPSNNPYPVILSIEMHCSYEFQLKMQQICTEELGDMLYLLPESIDGQEMASLPSPESLRNKILVKGKRAAAVFDDHEDEDEEDEPPEEFEGIEQIATPEGLETDAPDTIDGPGGGRGSTSVPLERRGSFRALRVGAEGGINVHAEMPHGDIRAQRSGGAGGVGGAGHVSHAVNEEWSKLVSLSAVRFKGFGHKYQGFEMSSFAEGKAVKLAQKQRSAFVQHNRRFLARIYPYGGRVDSSNMDPVPVWGAGCQMVALNFQTNDVALKLNHARFLENGNCGYVLKPPYQRGTGPKAAPVRLIVTVVSCQRLPNNFSKDVCGPYVTLTLRASKGPAKKKPDFCTENVPNNGFNPVFNEGRGEEFSFDVADRETEILQIDVMDKNELLDDELVGSNCIPISGIQRGFRHVSLFDSRNVTLPYAGVLCKFSFASLRGSLSEEMAAD